MNTTIVLLMGGNDSLQKAVGKVVAGIRNCRMQWIADFDAALPRAIQGDVGIALLHLDGRVGEQEVGLLLREIGRTRLPLPVVVISEKDDPDLRLRLLCSGAVDCLSRPVDLSRLAFLIDLVTVRSRYLPSAMVGPSASAEAVCCLDGFLAFTPKMLKLIGQVRTLSLLDSTVLLLGETGTGKSHLARLIHTLSPRKNEPFVVVECAALPQNLVESELFGYARGAFTGADQQHAGRFAAAGAGTVLLDDVDSVLLETQAKLLRAVEDRLFEPLGSTHSVAIQARLIVTANVDLQKLVAAGRFRADLYYRLNEVTLRLPSLRERAAAIPLLAKQFLDACCTRSQRPVPTLSDEAFQALQEYDWPGNIRELRNAMAQAAALCDGVQIQLADLPEAISGSRRGHPLAVGQHAVEERNKLAAARREGERSSLLEVLLRHRNNRTAAAIALGVSRTTLYKKLRAHALT